MITNHNWPRFCRVAIFCFKNAYKYLWYFPLNPLGYGVSFHSFRDSDAYLLITSLLNNFNCVGYLLICFPPSFAFLTCCCTKTVIRASNTINMLDPIRILAKDSSIPIILKPFISKHTAHNVFCPLRRAIVQTLELFKLSFRHLFFKPLSSTRQIIFIRNF